ncbi:MAG: PrsW family intramembrane metalloprotease [Bacteroidales bacterium]|nr:PrsW family intramembrane metalloprotease [Bacteroidales bacterium]
MVILLASLAPVIIILFYIYFRDKYEKEPLRMLVKALLAGVLIILPVIFVEQWLSALSPFSEKVGAAAWHAFVVAGTTEELFKYLALYLLIWKSPSFNEKFDGIVYAVFVSLGFAAVENVMYVIDGGIQTAAIRAVTAVPAHAIFGVTMGYYLGIAHMYKELKKQYLLKAIAIPVLLHGIYDFILMVEVGWLLILFFPYVILLYVMGIKKMKALSEASVFKPLEESSEAEL